MILIDANLLIYAKFSDLPQHVRARDWLEGQMNAPGKDAIATFDHKLAKRAKELGVTSYW